MSGAVPPLPNTPSSLRILQSRLLSVSFNFVRYGIRVCYGHDPNFSVTRVYLIGPYEPFKTLNKYYQFQDLPARVPEKKSIPNNVIFRHGTSAASTKTNEYLERKSISKNELLHNEMPLHEDVSIS
jgi:hypothetical protein